MAAEDLFVVDGGALPVPDVPVVGAAPPALVVPAALPVEEAEDAEVENEPAAKRSVDWKVLQFDEVGITGVYGGGVFRGSGIDHVRVCPADV